MRLRPNSESALATELGIGAARVHDAGRALLGALGEGIDDRKMRYVAGAAAVSCRHVLERIEVRAPVVVDAAGVGEVVLVHLFDIGRIAAEEVGVALVGLKNLVR